MPRSESDAHVRLKQLALDWARAAGYAEVAIEVRVPRSGYRADVAARCRTTGRVVVFECKQSRTDFLKDAHGEAFVRRRLEELAERQRGLEQMLTVHRPELRRGEAFWAEFDTWDFHSLEHRTYRRVLEELATLRRRARDGTKFSRMARWACADALYLVAEADLFAEAEIPAEWGVLVREGEELATHRSARMLPMAAEQRDAWACRLRSLARRRAGLPPEAAAGAAHWELALGV